MGALLYLTRVRLKNSLKSLVKQPGKLILIIIFVALIATSLWSGNVSMEHSSGFRDINELYAIAFVLFHFMMLTALVSGLNRGASFFTMADVNLLFNAPISNRPILAYGMVRQLGTTFMMAFFVLFQYGWISGTYGIGFDTILWILLGLMIAIFCAQLASLVIYSLTNSNPKHKNIAKYVIYGVGILSIAVAVYPALLSPNGLTLDTLIAAASRDVVNYLPISGWMRGFVAGVAAGDLTLILTTLGLTAVFIAVFVTILLKAHSEYYEDVLSATETSFSAVTAQKEGKMAENLPHNIKVGKQGIGKGEGAWVFYHKHLLESRRAKSSLFSLPELLFFVISVVFAFTMKEFSGIYMAFGMSLYFMMFESFMGRWAKELLMPYVYLIPQSPFKKMIALAAESFRKSVITSTLLMVVLGVITKTDPLTVFGLLLIRIGFSLLLISCNFLSERLFGTVSSKVMTMFLYILIILVVSIPGVVVMIVLLLAGATFLGILAMALWLVAASMLILFLCRNILSYAEFNYR